MSTFDLPLPEDRSSIQASIGEVLQRIADCAIDTKRAGLLLYGLQIASLNLPRVPEAQRDEASVEEITIDPQFGTLAPRTEITIENALMAVPLEELKRDSQPATKPGAPCPDSGTWVSPPQNPAQPNEPKPVFPETTLPEAPASEAPSSEMQPSESQPLDPQTRASYLRPNYKSANGALYTSMGRSPLHPASPHKRVESPAHHLPTAITETKPAILSNL